MRYRDELRPGWAMPLLTLFLVLGLALLSGCSHNGKSNDTPTDTETESDTYPDPVEVDFITDHGVTWTFEEPVLAGQFVTGDYWIIGPATVTDITPAPTEGRNGSVLNIPPTSQGQSGFDDRVIEDRWEPSLRAELPISLVPGDSLLSSISVETPGEVENWLREGSGEYSSSPVQSISVLTCLDEQPPGDAFRPSYMDTSNKIYTLSNVDRSLLPSLAPPNPVETDYIEMFAERVNRPWVDVCFYEFDAQVEYMPMYGREYGRVASIVSLLLMMDLPEEQEALQDQLLIGFVQLGIDLWGMVRAGYPGWYAHGGHGSGRKWPIVLAGILLGDSDMASPTTAYPDIQFGEDMHTAFASDTEFGPAWIGADVVYTGHMGIWNGVAVSSDPALGPYEHLAPENWLSSIGESYRRCCTSLCWVGQALAARLMNAQTQWNHDAFFDYVDRWMDPTGDADYTAYIYAQTGWDFQSSWAAHGQAWDDLVENMWTEYR